MIEKPLHEKKISELFTKLTAEDFCGCHEGDTEECFEKGMGMIRKELNQLVISKAKHRIKIIRQTEKDYVWRETNPSFGSGTPWNGYTSLDMIVSKINCLVELFELTEEDLKGVSK